MPASKVSGISDICIQSAGFLLPGGGAAPLLVSDGGSERLRCASVLKPLVFWAAGGLAPFASERERWRQLARQAVIVSDNKATAQAWETCGALALTGWLARRTGVRLRLEDGGATPFGRVLVTAEDLARCYASFAADEDGAVRELVGWMRKVPAHQTFGVRPAVARQLGAAEESVAVKCGWFCDSDEERLRTHAVTITNTAAGIVGTAVLTAIPIGPEVRDAYREADLRGDEVRYHEHWAGETLRALSVRIAEEVKSAG